MSFRCLVGCVLGVPVSNVNVASSMALSYPHASSRVTLRHGNLRPGITVKTRLTRSRDQLERERTNNTTTTKNAITQLIHCGGVAMQGTDLFDFWDHAATMPTRSAAHVSCLAPCHVTVFIDNQNDHTKKLTTKPTFLVACK